MEDNTIAYTISVSGNSGTAVAVLALEYNFSALKILEPDVDVAVVAKDRRGNSIGKCLSNLQNDV